MRIGITGMAVKTSLGGTLGECYEALCRGRDANAPLRAFDAGRYNAKHSYEIDDRQQRKDRPYRASEWLSEVIGQAVGESGVAVSGSRCGIFVGTGLRELRSVELWYNHRASIELDRLHFGGCAAARLPFPAPVYTFCNACSASIFALAVAMDLLQDGTYDVAIVGGIDSITESMFGLLDRVNPMHPQCLRSFNKDRRGVLMGEGAAAVVLEREPAARPKAWLRGVGVSCDAYQDTAPHRDGLVQAMKSAGERSGLAPAEIDLLFVHGTGTILNDQVELEAVREFFGKHANELLITGVKPSIGHTSGASGLISTVVAVQSLIEGSAPPIFGLHEPIEESEGMRLLFAPTPTDGVHNVQVNAFGFGGVNAVAVLARS